MSQATRYVLFYENGENYPAGAREHFPAHRARYEEFMRRGVLLGLGPFTDGETVHDTPLARALQSAGFRPTPRGLRLRG